METSLRPVYCMQSIDQKSTFHVPVSTYTQKQRHIGENMNPRGFVDGIVVARTGFFNIFTQFSLLLCGLHPPRVLVASLIHVYIHTCCSSALHCVIEVREHLYTPNSLIEVRPFRSSEC